MSNFSKRLDYILLEQGISQRRLSEMSGITEQTISRYVNDERVPKATEIVKIAKSLNVSIDYLLGQDKKDMTVSELITKLDILSNDITLPVNECIEYHRAKIIVEKIYKNVIG